MVQRITANALMTPQEHAIQAYADARATDVTHPEAWMRARQASEDAGAPRDKTGAIATYAANWWREHNRQDAIDNRMPSDAAETIIEALQLLWDEGEPTHDWISGAAYLNSDKTAIEFYALNGGPEPQTVFIARIERTHGPALTPHRDAQLIDQSTPPAEDDRDPAPRENDMNPTHPPTPQRVQTYSALVEAIHEADKATEADFLISEALENRRRDAARAAYRAALDCAHIFPHRAAYAAAFLHGSEPSEAATIANAIEHEHESRLAQEAVITAYWQARETGSDPADAYTIALDTAEGHNASPADAPRMVAAAAEHYGAGNPHRPARAQDLR